MQRNASSDSEEAKPHRDVEFDYEATFVLRDLHRIRISCGDGSVQIEAMKDKGNIFQKLPILQVLFNTTRLIY